MLSITIENWMADYSTKSFQENIKKVPTLTELMLLIPRDTLCCAYHVTNTVINIHKVYKWQSWTQTQLSDCKLQVITTLFDSPKWHIKNNKHKVL